MFAARELLVHVVEDDDRFSHFSRPPCGGPPASMKPAHHIGGQPTALSKSSAAMAANVERSPNDNDPRITPPASLERAQFCIAAARLLTPSNRWKTERKLKPYEKPGILSVVRF